MVTIRLNDNEQEALIGQSPVYLALYVFGIKRFMDFATGTVGVKRGISYQQLTETITVAPRSGINANSDFSRDQIRRMIKHLQRLGLIKLKSIGKRLICDCLLADKDNFDQKQAATRPPYQAATEAAIVDVAKTPVKTSKSEPIQQQAAIEADIRPPHQAATLPISGNNIINNIYIYCPIKSCESNTCRFGEFAAVYPRREALKRAHKTWVSNKLDKIADQIIEDVKNRCAKHAQWQERQFIPHPTTYLNGERWNDEVQEVNNNASQKRNIFDQRAEIVRSMLDYNNTGGEISAAPTSREGAKVIQLSEYSRLG